MKKILKSKTVWGLALLILSWYCKQKGIEIPVEVDALSALLASIGFRNALHGGLK